MREIKQKNFSELLTQLLIALIGVIFAYFLASAFNQQQPRFIIENPVVEKGKPIIIKAANKQANRNVLLNIQFDMHTFEGAGKPFKYNKDITQRWRFNITHTNYTPEMIKAGIHKMRFGFKAEDLCKEEQAISFLQYSLTEITIEPSSYENINGFYKAPFESEHCKKDLLTLSLKINKNRSNVTSFEYILQGSEGIVNKSGHIDFSKNTIYIPGLGQGKISINKENKFIFYFIYKDREVKFVQSNI